MADALDEISGRFGKLAVTKGRKTETLDVSAKFPPNGRLVSALDRSELSAFAPITDLGYYAWTPEGPYKELSKVSAEEIIQKIDVDKAPGKVLSTSALNRLLPKSFAHLAPQEHINKFPHAPPYIGALHVAVKHRDLDPNQIDFHFGGSTMEVLANGTIPADSQYAACLVPTTKILLVYKHKEYVGNYSDPGFQFERLVLGGSFRDRHDSAQVEHLQVINVGGHRVLFSADADGADGTTEDPVEIKSSNPRYWGTKIMFQMISSGSLSLIAGFKRRGTLESARKMTLADVIRDALAETSAESIEATLIRNMSALKAEVDSGKFDDEKVFEINFDYRGKLNLRRYKGQDFLPTKKVVESLIA